MESIRICNLRCLADTSRVEIKPITLLVGANSSGKSSFLRVFPLLRQSTEMRTLSGLLLNEGDVNFGFFDEALRRDANPAELKLEFGLTLQRGAYQGGSLNNFLIGSISATCELIYAKRGKDQRYPYLRSVRLALQFKDSQDTIDFAAEEDGRLMGFKVNEYQATQAAKLRLRVERGLVPTLAVALEDKESAGTSVPIEGSESGIFEQELLKETASLFHGLTANETRLAMFRGARIGEPAEMLAATKQVSGLSSWNQSVQNWTIESPAFRKVRNLLLARAAGDLLASINLYVSQLARTVHYFQPVRANVQRDYLSRDVQANSVDASGLNVAMVLASLNPSAQKKFREWTSLHFGFEIFPQGVSDGARVALRMKEGSTGAECNLADSGFGFSQMLPFLVQIWNLVEYEPNRPRNRITWQYQLELRAIPRSFLIVIEQPELHLHPALQARLADLFVAMVRLSNERKIPVRFMLETHSPTIIERIGRLVEAQHIKPDDVQVLLFERGQENIHSNTATVRPAHFSQDGVLQGWPFGFLAPPADPLPADPIHTVISAPSGS